LIDESVLWKYRFETVLSILRERRCPRDNHPHRIQGIILDDWGSVEEDDEGRRKEKISKTELLDGG
jgi:hypothetical protein